MRPTGPCRSQGVGSACWAVYQEGARSKGGHKILSSDWEKERVEVPKLLWPVSNMHVAF